VKLLQVNSVYGYGSTGRIVKDIHQASLKVGIDSYVAYGRGKHLDNRLIRIGSKKDIIYHGLKTRFFDQHGLASKSATRHFISQINELKPDVIHLHNIHGYYLNYPLFFEYLKSIEVKLIWTMHDCWAYTGHCSHYTYVKCNKWETHCNQCPQLNRYPKSLGLDNSFNNFIIKKDAFNGVKDLTIVTPSMWLKDQIKKSFLQTYPISVISNGIDLSIFKPTISNFRKKYNLEYKKIILGVASVWNERKGLDYFIEINSHLNENEVIVLVGTKPNKLLEGIITINRTNDTRELAEIYSAADVFLNPTLEETFGMVNLESIACGTPVVTFDSGGSKEAIIEGLGTAVESREANFLIGILREFYNKKSIKIKKNNLPSNLYSKNQMIKKYLKLYYQI
jgi:glycosyltransferase involved in cell wall biosynthesis